ncbi:MAG TPA: LPS export ABC transporter periplasmic protein LptC [Stellaceae bacterium]|nr:LPS export ABC transporter periplasmic protein LptC [Stellaceae bacterium]
MTPRPGVARNLVSASRRYSRFVALAKRLLPVLAVGLLLLLVAWPRVDSMRQALRLPIPRLDVSGADDLQMVNARYSGVDRDNRPFVVTAAVARQKPKLDNLVTLDHPKGDLTTTGGSRIELSADTGFYQPQSQLLDLFGNVALFQDKGNEFHSASAHVDMAAGTGEGDDPITGRGPFGSVTAQGFRFLDRGDTIIFTGHATLEMVPRERHDP